MGNRADLLEAAKRCLLEKGYDRTTVRDIASAAKVSMAAIGYHYGSREALLNEALFAALDDWGDRVGRALSPDADAGDSPAEQFESKLTRLIESVGDSRQFWLASLEAFIQAQRSPELRAQFTAGLTEGRRGLVAMQLGVPEDELSDDDVRTFGSVQLALISGLVIQWLTDTEQAPSAAEVLTGLRTLLGVEQD